MIVVEKWLTKMSLLVVYIPTSYHVDRRSLVQYDVTNHTVVVPGHAYQLHVAIMHAYIGSSGFV